MSRKDLINSDQTSFVDQAPLWQQTTQNKLDLKNNLRRNRNLRPFYFLLAFLLLIFLVFLFILLTKRKVNPDQTSINFPIEAEITVAPLEERVNTLQAELELADPNRQSLPFPNVDLELSFE